MLWQYLKQNRKHNQKKLMWKKLIKKIKKRLMEEILLMTPRHQNSSQVQKETINSSRVQMKKMQQKVNHKRIYNQILLKRQKRLKRLNLLLVLHQKAQSQFKRKVIQISKMKIQNIYHACSCRVKMVAINWCYIFMVMQRILGWHLT